MNKEVVLQSLELFWKGMLAIIIAMLLICVAIIILNWLTKDREKGLGKSILLAFKSYDASKHAFMLSAVSIVAVLFGNGLILFLNKGQIVNINSIMWAIAIIGLVIAAIALLTGIMVIPFMNYAKKHQQSIKKPLIFSIFAYILSVAAIVGACLIIVYLS